MDAAVEARASCCLVESFQDFNSLIIFCGCLLLAMGYIPEHALNNLKKYSYKGVDKYVYSECFTRADRD